MLIIRQGNLQIETTGRLVKRAEAQSIADAMDMLSAAQKEADEIRQQAKEEFEALKNRIYG